MNLASLKILALGLTSLVSTLYVGKGELLLEVKIFFFKDTFVFVPLRLGIDGD
jgi:hypothetical protein